MTSVASNFNANLRDEKKAFVETSIKFSQLTTKIEEPLKISIEYHELYYDEPEGLYHLRKSNNLLN